MWYIILFSCYPDGLSKRFSNSRTFNRFFAGQQLHHVFNELFEGFVQSLAGLKQDLAKQARGEDEQGYRAEFTRLFEMDQLFLGQS